MCPDVLTTTMSHSFKYFCMRFQYFYAFSRWLFTCGGLFFLVAQVFKKMRGIVAHFKISTLGLNKLHYHQASLGGSTSSPTADCKTRVSSSYDMALWFGANQAAVQLYDVAHPTTCASNNDGTVYRDHQLDLGEWSIVQQSPMVLEPLAWFNNILQGTQYVTISMVLPAVNLVIMKTKDDAMVDAGTGGAWFSLFPHLLFLSCFFSWCEYIEHAAPILGR